MRAPLRLAGIATVCLASAGCPGVPDLHFDNGASSPDGGSPGEIDATTGSTSGDAAGGDAGGAGDLPDVVEPADAADSAPIDAETPDAPSPPDAAQDASGGTCPAAAPPGTLCCGKTVCVGNKGQCGDCTACHLCDLEGFCCPAKVTCATSVDGCAK